MPIDDIGDDQMESTTWLSSAELSSRLVNSSAKLRRETPRSPDGLPIRYHHTWAQRPRPLTGGPSPRTRDLPALDPLPTPAEVRDAMFNPIPGRAMAETILFRRQTAELLESPQPEPQSSVF